MTDRYRPAEYQIDTVYKCRSCGRESQLLSVYASDTCHCGGSLDVIGELYPADPYEWDEERDEHGNWRSRY